MLTPMDYLNLFNTCELTKNPRKLEELDLICHVALINQSVYQSVQFGAMDIPWPVIAAIHFRESNQSFKKHLHNGDPLTARTVRVPAGRPVNGVPPFTWVQSATDALMGHEHPKTWDIASCLLFLERYNGLGYQKRGINSPYLWDYTDKYSSGLYTADGIFDPMIKEDRPGCVAILKTLAQKGISLDFTSLTPISTDLH